MRPVLAAMLLVACGREARVESADTAAPSAASARSRAADSQLVIRASELRIPIREDVTSGSKPACPASGRWAECSVFERLDRAGLAPRKDSGVVTEEPLTRKGFRLRIGNSELEVYVYPDLAARERDEAKLDKTKYADYSTALGMKPLPTLIATANLIAILHSRNEHQRERIGDALTAGPPQPARQ